MPRRNPAWTVRAFTDKWDVLSTKVLPRYMPIIQEDSRSLKKAVEYGCGHYGCVMPTHSPGVVIKMTSDPTEVAFVVAALGLYHKREKKGYWPEAMTKYLDAYYLKDTTFRKRPTAVIWRKSASEIGYGFPADREGRDAEYEMRKLLYIARELRDTIKTFSMEQKKQALADCADNRYFYPLGLIRSWVAIERTNDKVLIKTVISDRQKRARVLLRGYWDQIEVLQSQRYTYDIGGALDYYFKHKIVLADVHLNNIGKISVPVYSDESIYGITDPGHAIFFTDEYSQYTLETI